MSSWKIFDSIYFSILIEENAFLDVAFLLCPGVSFCFCFCFLFYLCLQIAFPRYCMKNSTLQPAILTELEVLRGYTETGIQYWGYHIYVCLDRMKLLSAGHLNMRAHPSRKYTWAARGRAGEQGWWVCLCRLSRSNLVISARLLIQSLRGY